MDMVGVKTAKDKLSVSKSEAQTNQVVTSTQGSLDLAAEWESFEKLIGGSSPSASPPGDSTVPKAIPAPQPGPVPTPSGCPPLKIINSPDVDNANESEKYSNNSGLTGKHQGNDKDSHKTSIGKGKLSVPVPKSKQDNGSSDSDSQSNSESDSSDSSDDSSGSESEEETHDKKSGTMKKKVCKESSSSEEEDTDDSDSDEEDSDSSSDSSEEECDNEKPNAKNSSKTAHKDDQDKICAKKESILKKHSRSSSPVKPASRKSRSGSRSRRSKSRSRSRKDSSSHRDKNRRRDSSRDKRRKTSHRSHRSRSRDRKYKRRSRSHSRSRRHRDRYHDRRRRRSRSRSVERKHGSHHRRRHRTRSHSRDRSRERRSHHRKPKHFAITRAEKKPLSYKETLRQKLLEAQKQAAEGKLEFNSNFSKDLMKLNEKPSCLPLNTIHPLMSIDTGLNDKVTPQQALIQTMAAMHQKAQELTGVALPKYYNPAAVNPLKFAEQVKKRKLLWSKKDEASAAGPSAAVVDQAPPPVSVPAPSRSSSAQPTDSNQGKNQWQATAFIQDDDGKVAAKFRKLMGIKQGESTSDNESANQTPMAKEQIEKQQQLFHQLDREYEFARMTTHTHRGVGLGFGTQSFQENK